jgi:threonine-phosphate decarboxylase
LPAALAAALVADHPDTLFVLDEAYCDLLPEPQWERQSLAQGNLIVLHSMTKYGGLAGLRLGHAVAEPGLAAALRAAAPPWSVNACAQAAGVAALADLEHHERAVALLVAERDRLMAGLQELGWTTEPTTAGFFLIRAGDATALRRELLASGRLVRDCTSFGLPAHIRVSPRHPAQNDLLLEAFAALAPPEAAR